MLVEFVIIGVPDVVTGRRIFRSKTVAVSTFIGYLSLLCGLRYCSNNVGEIFFLLLTVFGQQLLKVHHTKSCPSKSLVNFVYLLLEDTSCLNLDYCQSTSNPLPFSYCFRLNPLC